MNEQKYFSVEGAVIDLTVSLKPLGPRLSILEPSSNALAKTTFKKLKSCGIIPTKEEIKQFAAENGWEEKEAQRLSKKYGV